MGAMDGPAGVCRAHLHRLVEVPYPEQLIANMRADLIQYGVEEAGTGDLDPLLGPGSGEVLVIVYSVCGSRRR
jgi:hypothetical protein